ncbi:MAG: hypothetical protein ACJA0F_002768, partial [Dinoroseobacter sp.]
MTDTSPPNLTKPAKDRPWLFRTYAG